MKQLAGNALTSGETIATSNGPPGGVPPGEKRKEPSPGELVESPAEAKLLEAIEAFSLPTAVVQHTILDSQGRVVSRADFAYPGKKIAIFVDGYEYHVDKERWQKDMEQMNVLISVGWKPLRFPAKKVLNDPEACVRQIRQILDQQIH